MADVDTEEDASQDTTWLCTKEDTVQEPADNEMKEESASKSGGDSDMEDSVQESVGSSMEEYNSSQPVTRQSATPSVVRSKKAATSNLPHRPSDLPFRRAIPTWSLGPDGEAQHFDFTFPTLTPENGLYYSPTAKLLPRKSKKRDSDGNVKKMIAELNARADLVISRESSPSPRGRRFDRALPSPGYWRWDTRGLSPLLFRPSPMSPQRPMRQPTSPRSTKSREVEGQDEECSGTDNHKRKGSLLEWRNKELFEEPVRI